MTRKKTIDDYSPEQLHAALMRRWTDEHFTPGMTMSQMELIIWKACGMENPAALRHLTALLERMPLEKPTGKLCPKCGKRTPVKVKDRERTLRTMAGPVTLKRNYHHCESCQLGFYPLDRALDLPEEGELTREMEKRVLDFGINDVFGQATERWSVHYQVPISENLLRRVVARVGEQCQSADQGHLQEALKPSCEAAEVLVAQMDGSLLPICGDEPWKEAKVGVTYRHDSTLNRPIEDSQRYCAVLGTVANFAPVFEEMLIAEKVDEVRTVVFVGDGATHNWTLADQLVPDAVQVLDWHHAVQHAVDCGKVLLDDEESPYLPLWQERAETLLAEGEPAQLIRELMDCVPEIERKRRYKREALDNLVRYYQHNANRMRYRTLREHGFPIGSGAVESAHRHVLQSRMKRAGMHWETGNARRMGHLRAAYRTTGAQNVYAAIQRARRQTEQRAPRPQGRRQGFRFARQGLRDQLRAASN
jgi:hypothetical protein